MALELDITRVIDTVDAAADVEWIGERNSAGVIAYRFNTSCPVGAWLQANGHNRLFHQKHHVEHEDGRMICWLKFSDPRLATLFKLTWF